MNTEVLQCLREATVFQDEGILDTLLECLATPPATTTIRVNTISYSREEVVGRLSDILTQKYKRRRLGIPPITCHPVLNDVVVIPTRAPSGRLEPADKRVIVGLQCGEAVLRGADVFAPGVMGAPRDLNQGNIVSVWSDVDGLCRKGQLCYDGKVRFVGNGLVRMDRSEVFKTEQHSVKGVAVEMTDPLYDCPSLNPEDLKDFGFLQNLPSIVVGHVLDPQPHESVLDMCAAPGGKTVHIATLMNNKGCVIAIDKTSSRVKKLEDNVNRFGVSNVTCFSFDSTKSCLHQHHKEPLPHAPPFRPETFDRILLDAPCSALGQRPLTKCSLTSKELKSFHVYQRKFISQAVELLKPGGVLVYSTCTFSPDENEKQVAWLLKCYPQMKLIPQVPCVGYSGWSGFGLTEDESRMLQRFGPPQSLSHSSSNLHRKRTIASSQNSTLLKIESQEHVSDACSFDGTEDVTETRDINQLCMDTICFFIAKFIKNC